MSLRRSTFLVSRHCSGDMYSGVPNTAPVLVRPPVSSLSAISLAMPKSSSLIRTLAGMSGSGTR